MSVGALGALKSCSTMPAAQDHGQDVLGGGIFQGIKFWLSHRIPDRANVIALVKAGRSTANTHGYI